MQAPTLQRQAGPQFFVGQYGVGMPTQVPFLQVWPGLQALPQAPQWPGLLAKSTQLPLQHPSVVPGVAAQVASQSPQLWMSSLMYVHAPWQHF